MQTFEDKLALEVLKEKIKYELKNIYYYVTPDYYEYLSDRLADLNLDEEYGKFNYDDYYNFLNLILPDEYQLGRIAEADVNLVAYEHDIDEQRIIWQKLKEDITQMQRDKEDDI